MEGGLGSAAGLGQVADQIESLTGAKTSDGNLSNQTLGKMAARNKKIRDNIVKKNK